MPRKRNNRKIRHKDPTMDSTGGIVSEIESVVPTEVIVSKATETQNTIPKDVQIVSETTRRECEVIQIPPTREEYQARIATLEEELRVCIEERENFKNHLMRVSTPEKEKDDQGGIAANSNTVKKELDREENQQLRGVIASMKTEVKEKTDVCSRQVLQIEALAIQVAALKEVTSLTKGMLSIRSSENEKLKEQIDLMEKKVDSERVRNNAVLKKTELASSLNTQLRNEYQNQVKLMGELRETYEKKISLLAEEVMRLRQEQEGTTNGEINGHGANSNE